MQHGLLDSGGAWLYNDPDNSLAITLAKKGCDVWIGNNRGTTYSNKHVSLTDLDREYWDFTFNEMGKYDVPAFIDFILTNNKISKLTYFGHS